MDFKKHLETAWHLTISNLIPLIFMTLVLTVVSFLSFGILAPVTMAGYIQSILQMVRDNREPKLQDIFSQMHLFVPLLAFSIVSAIAIMIGFLILFLPGIIISLGLTFCFIYLMPLMTDRKMDLMTAMKESYRMAMGGQIMDHAVFVILYIGIIALGSLVMIGFLFTIPLATLLLASVYQERTN